jgi:tetratricopeptide (TPR) repeat protein
MSAFGAALCLFLTQAPLADGGTDTGAWYLQHFGPLRPRDATEARELGDAQAIFERLKNVADRRQRREPHLLVIARGGSAEARALPDGTIVINAALLRLCLRKLPPSAGQARLAFVIAHEMAHLANDDAWVAEAFASAERSGDRELAEGTRQLNDTPPEVREARADEAGFLSATMAGFDPAAILSANHDFLEEWARLFGGGTDALHQRSRLLRARLTELGDALPLFSFGVRLLQLGRPLDARVLLERYQRAFPGPEVESDLGLALLQDALVRLETCDAPQATRFQLPALIDPETQARRVRLRSDAATCPEQALIQEALTGAERWLTKAVERAPEYVPARANLASLLLLQGAGLRAYSLLRGNQREGQPCGANPEPALAFEEAVALYLAANDLPVPTADAALSCLERIEASATTPAESRAAATFARGRILSELGRRDAARSALELFLSGDPRGSHAEAARALLLRAGVVPKEASPGPPAQALPRLWDRLPAGVRSKLATARRVPFDLGDLKLAFLLASGVSALELHGSVEIVEEVVADTGSQPSTAGMLRRVPLWGGGDVQVFRGLALERRGGRVVKRVWFQP